MAADLEIDVDLLKSEIRKTYASVSKDTKKDFIFPTGRAWAEDLGYPEELANVPESAVESFAGVANPWTLGRLAPGQRVLDLGSGAGTDSLIAAQMVGAEGHVTGVDMTPEMLAKARGAATEMAVENADFVEAEAEQLPFADASFDAGDLERGHRPDPRQGRSLRRAVPRARARRATPDCRRNDPEPSQRRGASRHRPLDRPNSRGAAGGSVREASATTRLRTDRDRSSSSTRMPARSSKTRAARRRNSAPGARRSRLSSRWRRECSVATRTGSRRRRSPRSSRSKASASLTWAAAKDA